MVIPAADNSEDIKLSAKDLGLLLEYRDRVDAASIARDEAERRADNAENRVDKLQRELQRLQHQLGLLMKRLYGPRSEKNDPNQLLLFQNEQAPAVEEDGAGPPTTVAGHTRRPKGHGRDAFPAHLPRNRIPLDPEESERVCTQCGDPLCRVSEKISEKGEFVPGHWEVNQYVRGVWACKKGHGGVKMAPAPAGVVEKSRFEPSVYAHVAIAKYADHLPLHRQEGIFERAGFPVSRSTTSDMMRDLAILVSVIRAEMVRQLLASHFIQTDDTPMDVLVEREGSKRKRKKVKGHLWVYIAPGGIVVYDFTLTWAKEGPASFLKGFSGTHLQGDHYGGYAHVCEKGGLIKVACLAHVRRKFVEAAANDAVRSATMIWLIRWVYRVENLTRGRLAEDDDYGEDQAHAARQRLGRFVLAKFKSKLDEYKESRDVLPSSPLGEAVNYALNQWADLEHYLDHFDITPDNNASERALRPVVIGRKNYLFFGSPKGGDTAATLYTMVASCKALGIDPYAYLIDVTQRLVSNRETPPAELTPWAWQEARALRVTAEVAADVQATAAPGA